MQNRTIYVILILFSLVTSSIIYYGYITYSMDNLLEFIFMADCAHPLLILGILLIYHIYENGKVGKTFHILMTFDYVLLIIIGVYGLATAFYVEGFAEPLFLICHSSMMGIGLFFLFKNSKSFKRGGYIAAVLFVFLNDFFDLYFGTQHPYFVSNQPVIIGFFIKAAVALILFLALFLFKAFWIKIK